MLIAGPSAQANLIRFHVDLSGANEVPPTPSAGTGFVDLTLDTIAETLLGHIEFSGLGFPTSAAHIHCCLASPFLTGVNVGVATVVPAFPGFPLGVTSGVDDFLLHLNSASAYNPAFVTLQGSLANAEVAFINGLVAGETYLNIHTGSAGPPPIGFPGGEIRGFVTRLSVPEPMTSMLFALGLAAAGFVLRRRAGS